MKTRSETKLSKQSTKSMRDRTMIASKSSCSCPTLQLTLKKTNATSSGAVSQLTARKSGNWSARTVIKSSIKIGMTFNWSMRNRGGTSWEKIPKAKLYAQDTWSQTMTALETQEISIQNAMSSGEDIPTIATDSLKMIASRRSTATANSIKGPTLSNIHSVRAGKKKKSIWLMSVLQ